MAGRKISLNNEAGALHSEVWRVVELLGRGAEAPTCGHRLPELAAHFLSLHDADIDARANAEAQIWTIWSDHEQAQAKLDMDAGVKLFARGDASAALPIFEGLSFEYPNWAEAWNKRATVNFVLGRDAASVSDIHNVLEFEPRHFGALGGFAQICMRNSALDAAQTALQRLLDIHPVAPGIKNALAQLGSNGGSTRH
jgi:tetratricopeptide (TPR) repeat protein